MVGWAPTHPDSLSCLPSDMLVEFPFVEIEASCNTVHLGDPLF